MTLHWLSPLNPPRGGGGGGGAYFTHLLVGFPLSFFLSTCLQFQPFPPLVVSFFLRIIFCSKNKCVLFVVLVSSMVASSSLVTVCSSWTFAFPLLIFLFFTLFFFSHPFVLCILIALCHLLPIGYVRILRFRLVTNTELQ